MNEFTSSAHPRTWQIANASPRGGTLEIAGWDFGGPTSAGAQKKLALLHHANGMCGAQWWLLAQHLSRDYHVFAIDARGHGDSSGLDELSVPEDFDWDYFVTDLVAVAQQLLAETGLTTISLGLGSSFGGIVTAAGEASEPGLFERIVMLDPPIHPTPELLQALSLPVVDTGSQREGLVEQTLKRRALWPDREAAWDAWRQKPLFAPWLDEAFALYLSQGMQTVDEGVRLKCDPRIEAHIFATTGTLDVLAFAARVDVPVLLTHAALGFFPEEFFRRLVGLFPQGSFAQLNAGHMLPLESPDEVAALLDDWLSK